MIKHLKKLILLGFLVATFGIVILGFQLHQFKTSALNIAEDAIVFQIKSGSHIGHVAQQLEQQKLIEQGWMFRLLAKLLSVDSQLKAGEYSIEKNTSVEQLLKIFVKGRSIQYSQSIIEGYTFAELRVEMAKNPYLKQTITGKTAEQVMQAIGAGDVHVEGQFMPDTYFFPKGFSDIDFLKRAYKAMQKALLEEWQKRDKNLPLKSPYEALILASIIEKETGAAHERPLISAAFIKRLRLNMKLQTDPTIIYGMGDEFKGDIRYKDLRKDTPYNTYVHKGLTPTPIAMPGLLSIQAALHPADSEAIFFVSKGDGTHYFSETLAEHNEAVRIYQLKGRAPKRKADSGL